MGLHIVGMEDVARRLAERLQPMAEAARGGLPEPRPCPTCGLSCSCCDHREGE